MSKRKENTAQTASAWVKEVWMPQKLLAAVGPHYQDLCHNGLFFLTVKMTLEIKPNI
jgi:hypothetical protein